MDMDSSISWIHGYANSAAVGNNGFMCGYSAASSCTPADLQFMEEEQQQNLISSQIQHHLNQISMRMNTDDEEAAAAGVYAVPSDDGAMGGMNDGSIVDVDCLLDPPRHAAGSFVPSSSSSSTRSWPSGSVSLSGSPDPESSAQFLAAPAAGGGSQQSQYLQEVSSHVPPLGLMPAVYDHQQQYISNLHVPVPPPPAAPRHRDASLPAKRGAFKRYARHLGPRSPGPKPGACGQRMFKTAMSVLSKMHVAARYTHQQQQQQQQYYQQEAAEAVAPPTVNQLQHMFSERKRREKLNDSFHALKAVLPPGAKKDKTSILIRAREYVRSLESKVSELEEKNRSLESRLLRGDSSDGGRNKDADGGDSGDDNKVKVHVELTRASSPSPRDERAAAQEPPRDLCTLKIVVEPACNMADVVLRTLQCLKDQVGDDVSLVAMSTSGGDDTGAAAAKSTSAPRGTLTLQIKSPPGARWEEQTVKDAVAKVVADTLTLPSAATVAAPR
ncbi:hypothetical protein BS78_03G029900 [Paspalum vaginatum]|nr:hypothetical protein BS78_03G029900 [Paspalum vaginatum]